MRASSGRRMIFGMALVASVGALPFSAEAGDFFSNFFGAFGMRPLSSRPQIMLPFANEAPIGEVPRPCTGFSGGECPDSEVRSDLRQSRLRTSGPPHEAWCVRRCDGRYFPVTGPDDQAREESCRSFCPASETRLVYGSDIDNAVSENGKPYSELPNAFRYRNEIVAGCTCNGKDAAGLAKVDIESDPTLRKGDIVAGDHGLVVVDPRSGKRAALNFSPLPPSVQARFRAPE